MSFNISLNIKSSSSYDYKAVSREIRQDMLFKKYIVSKSKDRHELIFDFETQEKFDFLSNTLETGIKQLNYNIEITKL